VVADAKYILLPMSGGIRNVGELWICKLKTMLHGPRLVDLKSLIDWLKLVDIMEAIIC
jgi:hypothetical protein